jgi:hypothetical protein
MNVSRNMGGTHLKHSPTCNDLRAASGLTQIQDSERDTDTGRWSSTCSVKDCEKLETRSWTLHPERSYRDM